MFKKIFFIIVAIFMGCSPTVSAQDESQLALLKNPAFFAEVFNGECPLDIPGIGTVTHVEYTDKQLWMYLSLDEEYNNVETMKYSQAETKYSVKVNFASNPLLKIVCLGLVENDSQLCIRYYGKKTTASLNIILTTDDLLEMITMGDDETSAEAWLKNQVNMSKLQCPVKLDDGLTMTTVQFAPEGIYYVIEVDEALLSFDDIRFGKEEIKQGIIENLRASATINSPDRNLISKCIQNNTCIIYKYVGSRSKEAVLVKLTVAELRSI